jgi:DEAD/DEAH box helicase
MQLLSILTNSCLGKAISKPVLMRLTGGVQADAKELTAATSKSKKIKGGDINKKQKKPGKSRKKVEELQKKAKELESQREASKKAKKATRNENPKRIAKKLAKARESDGELDDQINTDVLTEQESSVVQAIEHDAAMETIDHIPVNEIATDSEDCTKSDEEEGSDNELKVDEVKAKELEKITKKEAKAEKKALKEQKRKEVAEEEARLGQEAENAAAVKAEKKALKEKKRQQAAEEEARLEAANAVATAKAEKKEKKRQAALEERAREDAETKNAAAAKAEKKSAKLEKKGKEENEEIAAEMPVKEKKSKKEKKRKHVEDERVIDGSEALKKSKPVVEEESVDKKMAGNKESQDVKDQEEAEEVKIVVEDQDIDDYKTSLAKADAEIPEHLRIESHNLSSSTIASLKKRGIKQLFPIQAASIGPILEGKDLLGRARTGTGKTLAFSLPMIEVLLRAKFKDSRSFSKRGRVEPPRCSSWRQQGSSQCRCMLNLTEYLPVSWFRLVSMEEPHTIPNVA